MVKKKTKAKAKDEPAKPAPPSLRRYTRGLEDMHPEYQMKILEAEHARQHAIAAMPDQGKLGPSAKNRFVWIGTELDAKINPKPKSSSAQGKRVRIIAPTDETPVDDKADDTPLDSKAPPRPVTPFSTSRSETSTGRNSTASPQPIDTRPLLERYDDLADDGPEQDRISTVASETDSWHSDRSDFWRKHGTLQAVRQRYFPETSITVPLERAKEFDFGV